MADLHPPLLSDAHDLQRAISWVVTRVERHGLRVRVEADSVPIALQEEVLTITYQAIHELLFNVLKHAQTLDATLTLQRDQDYLEAVVTDRGAGFDLDHRTPATTEGGFGLLKHPGTGGTAGRPSHDCVPSRRGHALGSHHPAHDRSTARP